MRINLFKTQINIEEACIILFLLCILSKTVKKYFAGFGICYLFIAFHEFSHMSVAAILGKSIKAINIKTAGLNIEIEETKKEGLASLVIYFAGPLSNILLYFLFFRFQMVREINMALAIINLLPIKPLDGYNIMKIILTKIFAKEKSCKICKSVNIVCIIIMIGLGILIAVKYNNFSLCIMSIYVIFSYALNYNKERERHNSFMYQKYYKNITKFNENYCNSN